MIWPADPKRLAKKQREIELRRQKQRERVAQMDAEDLARYHAWHAARKPGSAAARVRARQDREAAKLLAKPSPKPVNPEITRLEAELAAIRTTNERLKAEIAEMADEGVFS